MIDARGLACAYPAGPALRFDDVSVAPGGTLLLRGPSGSGKSSWLALAAGLLTPSAGVIRVAGQHVAALGHSARDAWRARHVGFLPQRLNLSEALSVADNLALVYFAAGLPVDRAAVAQGLAALEVADLAHRKPAQLSGGLSHRGHHRSLPGALRRHAPACRPGSLLRPRTAWAPAAPRTLHWPTPCTTSCTPPTAWTQKSAPLAAVGLPRFINDGTTMQAAAPAVEVTRLLSLVGVGSRGLQGFTAGGAGGGGVVGFHGAVERGARAPHRPGHAAHVGRFAAEGGRAAGVRSAVAGALGLLSAHGLAALVGAWLMAEQSLAMSGWTWGHPEWWVPALALGVALLAAGLPALSADRLGVMQLLNAR